MLLKANVNLRTIYLYEKQTRYSNATKYIKYIGKNPLRDILLIGFISTKMFLLYFVKYLKK